MTKRKNHIKIFKRILLIWLVLFSLSPCTVKEALVPVTADYSKPLNKSKTTAPIGCSYIQSENLQISFVKKSKINRLVEPVDLCNHHYFAEHSAKADDHYSKTSSGHSPPKYILYKRLKIDIA